MSRYISNTDEQRQAMLKEIGMGSIKELYADVPKSVYLERALNVPAAYSEIELVKYMSGLAKKNNNLNEYTSFLGAGTYDHFIPAVIDSIVSRQEFLTAYTPYQPEISQGTLQAIFEYQTMICQLTGMDIANASMYDGASALNEASIMAAASTRRKEVLVAKTVHPESRQAVKTGANFKDIKVTEFGYKNGLVDYDELEAKMSKDVAAIIVQYPSFFGTIDDLAKLSEIAHGNKSLLIVSADPISLSLLKSPGELGADIVVGDGQGLGNAMSFGGPHLGFFAASDKLMRKMPGRLVGETKDTNGKRGFVLTIQTREQHIRREKATSNICSNQALNALTATIYLSLLGKEGLKEVAQLSMQKAHYAQAELLKTGKFTAPFTAPFFKEFVLESKEPVSNLNKKLYADKIIGGYDMSKEYPELNNAYLVAVTERRTKEEIDLLARKVGE